MKKTAIYRLLLVCMLLLSAASQALAIVQVNINPLRNVMPPQASLYYENPGSFFSVSLNNLDNIEEIPVRLEVSLIGPLEMQHTWPAACSSLLELYSDRSTAHSFVLGVGSRALMTNELSDHFRAYPKECFHMEGEIRQSVMDASNGVWGLLPEGHYGFKITVKTNYPGDTGGDILGYGITYFDIAYKASAPEFLVDAPVQPSAIGLHDPTWEYLNVPYMEFPERLRWTWPVYNLSNSRSSNGQFIYTLNIYQGTYNMTTPEEAVQYGALAISPITNLTDNSCDLTSVVKNLRLKGAPFYVAQVQAISTAVSRDDPGFSLVENNGRSSLLVLGFEPGNSNNTLLPQIIRKFNIDPMTGGDDTTEEEEEGLVVPEDEEETGDYPFEVTIEKKREFLPDAVLEYFGENIANHLKVKLRRVHKSYTNNKVCMLLQVYNKNVGHGVVPRPADQKPHTTNNWIDITSAFSADGYYLSAEDLRKALGEYSPAQLVDFVPTTGKVLGPAPTYLSALGLNDVSLYVRVVEVTDSSLPISSQKTIGKGYLDVPLSVEWDADVLPMIKTRETPSTGLIDTYFENPGSIFDITLYNQTDVEQQVQLELAMRDPKNQYRVSKYGFNYTYGKSLSINPNSKKILTPEEINDCLAIQDNGYIEKWEEGRGWQEFEETPELDSVFTAVLTVLEHPKNDDHPEKVNDLNTAECKVTMNTDAQVKLELTPIETSVFTSKASLNYFNTPGNLFTATLTNLTDKELKLYLRLIYDSRYTGCPKNLSDIPEERIITLEAHGTLALDGVIDGSIDKYVGGYSLSDQVIDLTNGDKCPSLTFYQGTHYAVLEALSVDDAHQQLGSVKAEFSAQNFDTEISLEIAPRCKFAISPNPAYYTDVLSRNFKIKLTNNTEVSKRVRMVIEINDDRLRMLPRKSFILGAGSSRQLDHLMVSKELLQEWIDEVLSDDQIEGLFITEQSYLTFLYSNQPNLGIGNTDWSEGIPSDFFLNDGLNKITVKLFALKSEDDDMYVFEDEPFAQQSTNFYAYYEKKPLDISIDLKHPELMNGHSLNYMRRPSDYFSVSVRNTTDHLCERLSLSPDVQGEEFWLGSDFLEYENDHERVFIENLAAGGMYFLSDDEVDRMLGHYTSGRYGRPYEEDYEEGKFPAISLGAAGTSARFGLTPIVRDATYPENDIVYLKTRAQSDINSRTKTVLHDPSKFDAELLASQILYRSSGGKEFTIQSTPISTEIFLERKYNPMPINSDVYMARPEELYKSIILDNYKTEGESGYLYMNYFLGGKKDIVNNEPKPLYWGKPKESLAIAANSTLTLHGVNEMGDSPISDHLGGVALADVFCYGGEEAKGMPSAMKDGKNCVYAELITTQEKNPLEPYDLVGETISFDEEFEASSDVCVGQDRTLMLEVTPKDKLKRVETIGDLFEKPSDYYEIKVTNLTGASRNLMVVPMYDSLYVNVTGKLYKHTLALGPQETKELSADEIDRWLGIPNHIKDEKNAHYKYSDDRKSLNLITNLSDAKMDKGKHQVQFLIYRYTEDEENQVAAPALAEEMDPKLLDKPTQRDTLYYNIGALSNDNECFHDYTKDIEDKKCASFTKLEGMKIQVGDFFVTLNKDCKQDETSKKISGSGVLEWRPNDIPVKINVEFSGLSVNAARECFDGAVTSKKDEKNAKTIPYEWFSESKLKDAERADYIRKMKEDQQANSAKYLEYYNLVRNMKSIADNKQTAEDRTYTLPCKVPNTLLDEEYETSIWPIDVQLISIYASPKKSYMNLIGEFIMPDINTDKGQDIVMFGAPQLCMSNAGWLPDEGRMAMMTDYVLNVMGNEFRLVAPTDWENTTDGCYYAWKNGKFEMVTLAASITVPDLIAVDSKYEPIEDGSEGLYKKAAAQLNVSFRDKENWIGKLKLGNFQIKDLNGYTFMPTGNTEGILYDHSSKETPLGMKFPDAYDKNVAGFDSREEWKGFYLEQCAVRFPDFFKEDETATPQTDELNKDLEPEQKAENAEERHLMIGIKDLFYDNKFTCSFVAQNIGRKLKSGGWGLQLDEIGFSVLQSKFGDFHFNGAFNVPIFTESIGFMGSASSIADGGTRVEFKVQQTDSLKLGGKIVTLELDKQQSYFDVKCDVDKMGKTDTKVELCLGGFVYIEALKKELERCPLDFSISGMKFVGMRLANFKASDASMAADLANKQAESAGMASARASQMEQESSDDKEASSGWADFVTGKGYEPYSYEPDPNDKDALKFYFNLGRWKLASPRKMLGPLGFSLTDFKLKIQEDTESENKMKMGLSIGGDVDINNILTAGATVDIWSYLDKNNDLKYKETTLNEIRLSGSFGGALMFDGTLNASDDPELGDGFSAALSMSIPKIVSLDMNGGFYRKDKSAEELAQDTGSNPRPRYTWGWIEAEAESDALANITPVSIKGLKGGFYFNSTKAHKASYQTYGGLFGMTMTFMKEMEGEVDATVIYDNYRKRLSNFTFNGNFKALEGTVDVKATLVYANPDEKTKYLDLMATYESGIDLKELAKAIGLDEVGGAVAEANEFYNKTMKELTGSTLEDQVKESSSQKPNLQNSVGVQEDEKKTEQNSEADLKENEEKQKEGAVKLKSEAHISMNLHVNFIPDPLTQKKRWHIYIGEPSWEKRCRVTWLDFQIGQKTDPVALWAKIEANAYLCFGNELPDNGRMPELPKELSDFLNDAQDANGEALNKKASILAERQSQADEILNGDGGIMMGAYLGGAFGCNAMIAYVDASVFAGFDLALQKLKTGARCSNIDKRPGRNGWYGKGQVYAMIDGEIGAMVNLWFVKGRIPFCEFAVGAQLQGGGPNPSWMYGRTRAKVSLLGGLFTFNNNITYKAGEICVPDYGNPLDNINIIGDVSPSYEKMEEGWRDEETMVSPYTVPQFTTNMKIGREIRLVDKNVQERAAGLDGVSEEYEANAERIYRFIFSPYDKENFFASDYQVGIRDSIILMEYLTEDDTAPIRRRLDLESNGTDDGFTVKAGALEPNKLYSLQIVGCVQEKVRIGNTSQYKWEYPHFKDEDSGYTDQQRYWGQSKTVYFRTGPLPEELTEEDIAIARPGKESSLYKDNILYQDEAHHPYLSLKRDRWDGENGLNKEGHHIYGKLEVLKLKETSTVRNTPGNILDSSRQRPQDAVVGAAYTATTSSATSSSSSVGMFASSFSSVFADQLNSNLSYSSEINSNSSSASSVAVTFTPSEETDFLNSMSGQLRDMAAISAERRNYEWVTIDSIDFVQHCYDKDIYLWEPVSDFLSGETFSENTQYRLTIIRKNDEAESKYDLFLKEVNRERNRFEGTSRENDISGLAISKDNYPSDGDNMLDLQAYFTNLYKQEAGKMYGAEDVAIYRENLLNSKAETDFYRQLYQATFTVRAYNNLAEQLAAEATVGMKYADLKLGHSAGASFLTMYQYDQYGADKLKLTEVDDEIYHTYPWYYTNPYFQLAYWLNYGLVGGRALSDRHPWFKGLGDMPSTLLRVTLGDATYRNASQVDGQLQDLPNMKSGFTFAKTVTDLMPQMFYKQNMGKMTGYSQYLTWEDAMPTIRSIVRKDATLVRRFMNNLKTTYAQYKVTAADSRSIYDQCRDEVQANGKKTIIIPLTSGANNDRKIEYHGVQNVMLYALGMSYGLSWNDVLSLDINKGRIGLKESYANEGVPDEYIRPIRLLNNYTGTSDGQIEYYYFVLFRPNAYHTAQNSEGYTLRDYGGRMGGATTNSYRLIAGGVSDDIKHVYPGTDLTPKVEPADATQYISDIAVAIYGSGNHASECQKLLTTNGYNVISQDLNAPLTGANTSNNVFMGYKTTTDPSRAIRDVMVYYHTKSNESGVPETIKRDGFEYRLCNYLGLSDMRGNMNYYTSRKACFLYACYDEGRGKPLTSLSVYNSGSEPAASLDFARSYDGNTKTYGTDADLNWDTNLSHLYLQLKDNVELIDVNAGADKRFVSSVMTCYSTDSEVAKNLLSIQGYTVIGNMNGISNGSRYCYVGVKYTAPGDHNNAITDLRIIKTTSTENIQLEMDGKTYYRCPAMGYGNGDIFYGEKLSDHHYLYYSTSGNELSGKAISNLRLQPSVAS